MAKPRSINVCPLCGTPVGQAATKCIVCGSGLTQDENVSTGGGGITGKSVALPELQASISSDSDPSTTFPSQDSIPTSDSAKRIRARGGHVSVPVPVLVGFVSLLVLGGLALTLFSWGVNPFLDPTSTATSTMTRQPTFTPYPTSTPTNLPTSTPLPALAHKVQEGDSCIRLAVIYDVSVQSILQLNGFVQACPIFVGQEVLVPQPTSTPAPTATQTLAPQALTQVARPTHVVSAGESLSSIAAYFGVSFRAMSEINGKLPPDYAITVGETLVIPIDIPIPTEGPTPTATPLPPYMAPVLLYPSDGAMVSSIEQTVGLQWASIGELQENESYKVVVEDVTANSDRRIEATTLTNRHIVTVEMKPYEASPHVFKWTVVVVRQAGTTSDGKPLFEPAGATSEERTFTWTGIGVVPVYTSTPQN